MSLTVPSALGERLLRPDELSALDKKALANQPTEVVRDGKVVPNLYIVPSTGKMHYAPPTPPKRTVKVAVDLYAPVVAQFQTAVKGFERAARKLSDVIREGLADCQSDSQNVGWFVGKPQPGFYFASASHSPKEVLRYFDGENWSQFIPASSDRATVMKCIDLYVKPAGVMRFKPADLHNRYPNLASLEVTLVVTGHKCQTRCAPKPVRVKDF